jgi:hypothetical protein
VATHLRVTFSQLVPRYALVPFPPWLGNSFFIITLSHSTHLPTNEQPLLAHRPISSLLIFCFFRAPLQRLTCVSYFETHWNSCLFWVLGQTYICGRAVSTFSCLNLLQFTPNPSLYTNLLHSFQRLIFFIMNRIGDYFDQLNGAIGRSTFGRVFRLEGSGHVSVLPATIGH